MRVGSYRVDEDPDDDDDDDDDNCLTIFISPVFVDTDRCCMTLLGCSVNVVREKGLVSSVQNEVMRLCEALCNCLYVVEVSHVFVHIWH